VIGTVFWGCGFTWAKAGGEAANRAAGLADGAAFGPIFLLACRFALAGILWMCAMPATRRGWSWPSAARALVLGGLLSLGLVLQHLGLDRTSEAVSAFLTSLTILFIPLVLTIGLRRPPPAAIWAGVALATVGVWLMTGASPAGLGIGEVLGLACSVAFTFYILSINALLPVDDPARMTGGQFLIVGAMTAISCAILPETRGLGLGGLGAVVVAPGLWPNLLLLIVFPTLAAFGLMMRCQPRVDPTRAAMIYLLEPVFAALYAYLTSGRTMPPIALAGAALILVANGLAEAWETRERARAEAAKGAPPV
jgi:drug/metabolite transporter (DMT)-like permease